jgi:hypothetical protein
MYSFPGAIHDLRRKRVRERTKLYNISTIVMVFSLCLAQQAQAGAISIHNKNCVWQGLARTNQAKFHVSTWRMGHFRARCSSEWITLRAGSTQTVQVVTRIPFIGKSTRVCNYVVEAEGVGFSNRWVSGENNSKYACEADGAGVCQCRTE